MSIEVSNISEELDRIENLSAKTKMNVVATFRTYGEIAVKTAREKGKPNDYNDITGNLRHSIGYMILLDGRIEEQVIKGDKPEAEKETESLF